MGRDQNRERSQSIDTLNDFLGGEIAAVETYLRALGRLGRHEKEPALRACMASHERRVEVLRRCVSVLGGEPAELPGQWGPDGGVRIFGDGEAAITQLEEGEDRGLEMYLHDVCKLDRASRLEIEREILPEQIRTHDSLNELRLQMAAP